jgi:protein disulfide-isomerase
MNNRLGFLLMALLVSFWQLGCSKEASVANDPYDEAADAAADVEAAVAEARATGRLVLLNFGANWCPDCRAFSRAMEDPELAAIIDHRFVMAKIDVGNWDKNPGVVDDWDNPIAEGIPAVVVATPDGEILFATSRGQISSARTMGQREFAEFFRLLADLGKAG